MLKFPKDEVFKLASNYDGIGDDAAKWISGLGKTRKEAAKPVETSNGACIRLGLLLHENLEYAEKLQLPDEVSKHFLDLAAKKNWYPAWRDWILSNRTHKVDETRLPSFAGKEHVTSMTADEQNSDGEIPTKEEILEMAEELTEGREEIDFDEVYKHVEQRAKSSERRLHSSWRRIADKYWNSDEHDANS